MVAINRSRVKGHSPLSRRSRKNVYDKEKLAAAAFGCLCVGYVLFMTYYSGGADRQASQATSNSVKSRLTTPPHPELHVPDPNSESYDAIALDIINTLDCKTLLNQTTSYLGADDFVPDNRNVRRRRLDQARSYDVDVDRDDTMGTRNPYMDDYTMQPRATGQHLFCMAAFTINDQLPKQWKDQVNCDATGSRQQALLDLWSSARSEMTEDILKTILDESGETERDLVGNTLSLWAPLQDDGLDFMLRELNDEQKNVDHGGIYGLKQNLGEGRLFVDVGSCLGVSGMAVALLYPGTHIVSIEAASPNWLLQEINWACNDKFDNVHKQVLLSGVGPSGSTRMAMFMWRPQATTSTRAWTPISEHVDADVELTVKLRPWRSILSEAEIKQSKIDVLNVDCEGCEYNLIPSLTNEEFDSLNTVMGGIHWGYIPEHKLPSSKRGRETHERLCRHENFARAAKECCAFPELPVLSSVPEEILVQEGGAWPPKQSTVSDVAGELCDDFDTWAAEHHLDDIESDWGWFELTSMAEE